MSPETQKFVVYMGITVSSLIALGVICAVIILPFVDNTPIPAALENWGGLIIGFYFGSFMTLIKDWSGVQAGSAGAPVEKGSTKLGAGSVEGRSGEQ